MEVKNLIKLLETNLVDPDANEVTINPDYISPKIVRDYPKSNLIVKDQDPIILSAIRNNESRLVNLDNILNSIRSSLIDEENRFRTSDSLYDKEIGMACGIAAMAITNAMKKIDDTFFEINQKVSRENQ